MQAPLLWEPARRESYAGDELLYLYGMADSVSSLEADLNRIYMGYSLPRMDYFKNVRVSATGDVDTIHFTASAQLYCFCFSVPFPYQPILPPALRP